MTDSNGSDWHEFGSQLLDDTTKLVGQTLEELTASFRWLMASLFAANGGALVALISVDHMELRLKLMASSAFALGVLSSLVMAFFNMRYAAKANEALLQMKMSIANRLRGKEGADQELLKNIDALSGARRHRWPMQIAGYAAFVLLALGFAAGGLALNNHSYTEISPTKKISYPPHASR